METLNKVELEIKDQDGWKLLLCSHMLHSQKQGG